MDLHYIDRPFELKSVDDTGIFTGYGSVFGNVDSYKEIVAPGAFADSKALDGRITRSGDAQARLLRDSQVVYEGKIGSLRRFKDDVSEVKTGFECGIGFEKYNDIKVGDIIEAFVVERVATPV